MQYIFRYKVARKEYRTLTVRKEAYERFHNLARKLRQKDYRMYHTQVLDLLIDTYEKSKKKENRLAK